MTPTTRRLGLFVAVSLAAGLGVLVGRATGPEPPAAPPAVSIPVRVITKEIPAPPVPATLERVRQDQGLEGRLVCYTILKGDAP